MKFEMSSSEFQSFCAQLSAGSQAIRVQELESELRDVRQERDQAFDDRDYAQRRQFDLSQANDELQRQLDEVSNEIRSIKVSIKEELQRLIPFRLEKGLSTAFGLFLTGQKIFAIKEIRSVLNLGLREAKDVVDGEFRNSSHPNLVTLSFIFAGLRAGDAYPIEAQRERLAKILNVTHSDQNLDLILSGKFQTETVPNDAQQSA